MTAKDPDSGDIGLPEQQIRDEIMIFLFAAHDTTSTALTWSLAYLESLDLLQGKPMTMLMQLMWYHEQQIEISVFHL